MTGRFQKVVRPSDDRLVVAWSREASCRLNPAISPLSPPKPPSRPPRELPDSGPSLGSGAITAMLGSPDRQVSTAADWKADIVIGSEAACCVISNASPRRR